jgi:hypothetical protein
MKNKFFLKSKSFILSMNCLYFISNSGNYCGDQGAANLCEGLYKLINISNLNLDLRYLNSSILYKKLKMNFYWKKKSFIFIYILSLLYFK